MAAASIAASKCISHVLFKAMRKPKHKELAGQFESDKVVEDESVNESLNITEQSTAFGEKSTLSREVLHWQ